MPPRYINRHRAIASLAKLYSDFLPCTRNPEPRCHFDNKMCQCQIDSRFNTIMRFFVSLSFSILYTWLLKRFTVIIYTQSLGGVISRKSSNHRGVRVPVTVVLRWSVSRLSWRRVVAMFLAAAAIAAACIAVFIQYGFLWSVTASPILVILYGVFFHSRWCYVALKTSMRDLR